MTTTREQELVTEVERLRAELDRARALAADATEYRVFLPDHGGIQLRLRRGSAPYEAGWSVAVPAYGGGMALTELGWSDSIGALSADRLFCWPDPETAIRMARETWPE